MLELTHIYKSTNSRTDSKHSPIMSSPLAQLRSDEPSATRFSKLAFAILSCGSRSRRRLSSKISATDWYLLQICQ